MHTKENTVNNLQKQDLLQDKFVENGTSWNRKTTISCVIKVHLWLLLGRKFFIHVEIKNMQFKRIWSVRSEWTILTTKSFYISTARFVSAQVLCMFVRFSTVITSVTSSVVIALNKCKINIIFFIIMNIIKAHPKKKKQNILTRQIGNPLDL